MARRQNQQCQRLFIKRGKAGVLRASVLTAGANAGRRLAEAWAGRD